MTIDTYKIKNVALGDGRDDKFKVEVEYNSDGEKTTMTRHFPSGTGTDAMLSKLREIGRGLVGANGDSTTKTELDDEVGLEKNITEPEPVEEPEELPKKI